MIKTIFSSSHKILQLKVHKNIQKLMMNNLLQFLLLCQVFGTALLSWQQCKILEDQPCFIGQSVIRPNAFKSHGQWCRQAQVRGEGIKMNLSCFRSVGYGSKLLTWHSFGIQKVKSSPVDDCLASKDRSGATTVHVEPKDAPKFMRSMSPLPEEVWK